MKKGILFLGCVTIATFMFGQNNVNIRTESRLLDKKETLNTSSNESNKSNVGSKRVSDYFQFEKKIAKWTINNDIPASTPKHVDGQTKPEYALILLNWAKQNSSLMKPEFKSKLEDEQQFQELIEKTKQTK